MINSANNTKLIDKKHILDCLNNMGSLDGKVFIRKYFQKEYSIIASRLYTYSKRYLKIIDIIEELVEQYRERIKNARIITFSSSRIGVFVFNCVLDYNRNSLDFINKLKKLKSFKNFQIEYLNNSEKQRKTSKENELKDILFSIFMIVVLTDCCNKYNQTNVLDEDLVNMIKLISNTAMCITRIVIEVDEETKKFVISKEKSMLGQRKGKEKRELFKIELEKFGIEGFFPSWANNYYNKISYIEDRYDVGKRVAENLYSLYIKGKLPKTNKQKTTRS